MTEHRYIHAKPGSEKHAGKGVPFTEDRWEVFLCYYAKCGLVNKSAWAAGVTPGTITVYRKNNEQFAELFDQAQADYRESIEAEVHRRGVEGWDEPVYQKGEMVGTVRRHSDRMLELLTKRHIPEFRDKVSVDANVSGGVMVVPATAADADDWEKQFGEKAKGRSNG